MTHKVRVEQEAVGDQETKILTDGSAAALPAEIKIATFRRGMGVFFRDFPAFRQSLKIRQLISMCQSESDGNITLTVAYR
jgi:hypothetical protein